MKFAPLVVIAALGGCGGDDSGESEPHGELVPLAWRTVCVGDRYEVELTSRCAGIRDTDGSVRQSSLSATMRYADEVLAVEDGRATRVRRTFRSAEGAAADASEVEVRAGRGAGDGRRTDHFRQFERLLPSSYGIVDAVWNEDGALGAPPSTVLDIPDAVWLASRCTCALRRADVIDGRRTAVFEVRIAFEGTTGPSRLDGTLLFDMDEGLLREVRLGGSASGRQYELHGTQRVVAVEPPR